MTAGAAAVTGHADREKEGGWERERDRTSGEEGRGEVEPQKRLKVVSSCLGKDADVAKEDEGKERVGEKEGEKRGRGGEGGEEEGGERNESGERIIREWGVV
ncbi:hypothetical protein CLOP_g15759 [Closterium sp. NIES-67]|nr:hypothetical protein CLOP_g15759 [Closterium sp. NIES-67]